MVRTTASERKNIRNYIMNHFDCSGYDYEKEPETFDEIATFIMHTFYKEKVRFDKRKMSIRQFFYEWCQGLPSVLDTCYYYNRNAVDDLKEILTDHVRFTSEERIAESQITELLFQFMASYYKGV